MLLEENLAFTVDDIAVALHVPEDQKRSLVEQLTRSYPLMLIGKGEKRLVIKKSDEKSRLERHSTVSKYLESIPIATEFLKQKFATQNRKSNTATGSGVSLEKIRNPGSKGARY